jgi:predicted small integral membrane protein
MRLAPDHRLHQVSLLTKAGLILSIGLFGLLVAWTNVTAYAINYQFVQHVLSMDALASWAQVDALTDRAITGPAWHQVAYAGIIAAEFAVGVLCSVGGLLLLVAVFSHKPHHLGRGKAFALAGCGLGVAVWYLGFAVIGAEYFAMWASDFNGQATAYAFSGILLLSMIYVAQPEARVQSLAPGQDQEPDDAS